MQSDISYRKILRQAFDIVWRHKWLWVLGFLVSGFGGQGVDNPRDNNTNLEVRATWQKALDWVSTHILEVALLSAAVLLLVLLFLYISSWAKAGLIYGVDKITEKQEVNLRLSFRMGRKYVWRIIGLSVASLCVILLTLVLIGVPVGYLMYWKLQGAILMLVLGVLIFLVLIGILAFTVFFAQIFIVLGNQSLQNSIHSGFNLFVKNWRKSILLALSLMLAGLGIAIISSIVFALLGPIAPIFAIVLGAILAAWQSAVWVIFWKEIVIRKSISPEELQEVKGGKPATTTS